VDKEKQILPEWVKRLRYSEVATYKAYQLKPAKARSMEAQQDQVMAALHSGDEAVAEQLWYKLQLEANQWIDEAMPVVTIDTGLKR
jgi:hypothetical protein